ncbi:uncharacterized protein Dmoj_GI20028 [Drosophila mojavensis]|uniref:MD-2-related lipid-recognition domain-containing protein n=2 Tax=Drosophila mojavensis TaxID=7230 RepID=B4KTJ6_DROMO|nr:uncharacterized protein Dmoj_GI20028 [Drosophila mojavensis]
MSITGHFEFNNLQCLTHDKEYVEFEYCYLKSMNRTYKYCSIKTILHQLPLRSLNVKFKVLRRDTRTIFGKYDGTVNVCKFFKDGRNPAARIIFSVFTAYSNMNHTCPFNHDLMVDKLPVHYVNKIIASYVPDGRYFLNMSWYTENIALADVIVYFTKS